MNYFDSIAQYYEVLSDGTGRLQREGPLLREVLAGAPGQQVADLACGTGIHAEFLAGLGAKVTAFDISSQMVEHARTIRSHRDIDYRVGDMRELHGGEWDCCICLGNSLSVLESLEQVQLTFERASDSLAPSGLFLVHVLNAFSLENQKPRHRVERRQIGDIEIVAVKNLVPEGEHTLLSLSFYAIGPDGRSSVSETAFLMNLTVEQLVDCGEKAGLKSLHLYGSFDKSEYSPDDSKDVVLVLQRPAAA